MQGDPTLNAALGPRVVQALFGAATCALVARIGWRVGGERVWLPAAITRTVSTPVRGQGRVPPDSVIR